MDNEPLSLSTLRKATAEELAEELKRRRSAVIQICSTEEIEEELRKREKRRWDAIRSTTDTPPKLVEK